MLDLILGGILVISVASGVFLLTRRVTRSWPRFTCTLASLAVVLLMILYVHEYWYSAQLARWLPFSNLIVIGNWLPLLAGALAGLAWDHVPGTQVRRSLSATALILVAAFSMCQPFLGSVPQCGNQWDATGVCIQTTDYTCSPASAATLLKMHGIDATEQEMAQLCVTRRGTSWPGLYRGLKLKTAGTRWDVEVLDGTLHDVCRQAAGQPCILSVGLERNARVDASFSEEYGWLPGVNHSVVLIDSDPRGVEILDPSQPFAREHWNFETMQLLWRGLAIRLVKRS